MWSLLTHLVGSVQLVLAHLAGGVGAAAPDHARQSGPLKAGNPAVEAVDRTIRGAVLLLGGGGEQIDVPEGVVGVIEGVGPVQQGFHLTSHLVIVDRSGKTDDVRRAHLLHNGVGVVLNDTPVGLQTGHAAVAEVQLFPLQGDKLHLVPSVLSALGKQLGQQMGIAAGAQAGGDDQNVFTHMGSSLCESIFDSDSNTPEIESPILIQNASLCLKPILEERKEVLAPAVWGPTPLCGTVTGTALPLSGPSKPSSRPPVRR